MAQEATQGCGSRAMGLGLRGRCGGRCAQDGRWIQQVTEDLINTGKRGGITAPLLDLGRYFGKWEEISSGSYGTEC